MTQNQARHRFGARLLAKFRFRGKPDQMKKEIKSIAALSELELKSKGKIEYLRFRDHAQTRRLMSIGILPGVTVTLLQKFPSYVISLGHAQFAIDKELASAIYVRLVKT